MVKDMQDWEVELNKVAGMLKVRLELLKESGLTYMPKNNLITQINNHTDLLVLKESLVDCKRCKLCEHRTQVVFGCGNAKASVVFVGEGPGADEDAKGEPFVGRAGQLLTKMINAMGLSREQVYICNVVKCRPPENRNPEPDEIAACEPFLKQQLDLIKPQVIVGLGRYACQTLLQSSTPIAKIRGMWHEYEGIKFMPTFHPAYLLRNPPAKKYVWEDLQAVMRELGI